MTTHAQPLEALSDDPMAAVAWLRVYMTYFRNMVLVTAERLQKTMGLRAAMMTLGDIVEEAIWRSFSVQREMAAKRGMKLETLDDLFTLNTYCHHDAASRLSSLGIEVFEIRKEQDGRYIMETDRCKLFEALDSVPVLRVFPAALVSGLVNGLGLRSKWLSSPRERGHLCTSVREGHSRRYDYVVYMDESVEPPACRIVTEPLDCGQ